MNTTNERPTPETDASEMPIDRIDTVASRPCRVVISEFARKLERERDEAREELENHVASTVHTCHDKCKRPMCVLRRERNEALAESLEQSRLLGMSGEREAKLLVQLAAERALADRLAMTLGTFCGGTSSKSYAAWKEARND